MADIDDILAMWRDGYDARGIAQITDRSSMECAERISVEVRRLMHDSACGIDLKHRDGSLWKCSSATDFIAADGQSRQGELSLDCCDGERVILGMRDDDPRWRDFRLVQAGDRHETVDDVGKLLLTLCDQFDKYGLDYGHKMDLDVQAWWERSRGQK